MATRLTIVPAPAAAFALGLLASSLSAQAPPPPAGSHGEPQHRSSRRDAYVLSVGGQWMSSGVNFDNVGEFRRDGRGDFLWFRRGGRTWVVDDAATIQRADSLFEPLRALEPEQEALHDKESALDHRERAPDAEEESIDAAMERLEPEGDWDDGDDDVEAPPPPPSAEDDRQREELQRRLEELHEKQRALNVEQRAFAREERALDQREEDLERDAEGKLWKLMDELVASGAAKPGSGF